MCALTSSAMRCDMGCSQRTTQMVLSKAEARGLPPRRLAAVARVQVIFPPAILMAFYDSDQTTDAVAAS